MRLVPVARAKDAMSEPITIAEEAANWLAAIECDTADRAAFEAWRAQSPAHAVAFLRVQRTWQQVGAAAAPEPAAAEPHPAAFSRRGVLRAAVAVLAVGAGGTFFATRSQAESVSTGIGERRRLFIAPETCLDLNTATTLRWKRVGAGYAVTLERGEVSLLLAPGSAPCTVEAAGAQAHLLRGDFNVRIRDGDAEIASLRGEAALRSAGTTRTLPSRGRMRVSGARGSIQRLSDEQAAQIAAWRQGEIVFDGEPLGTAIAEYNRYLTTPIALGDPSLGSLQLGGRFLTSDPSTFLAALSQNFGVQAHRDGAQIVLRRG
jgi:transmembrane sensor